MAFGKTVAEQGVTQERIAEARCQIEQARLLTLKAAWMMDTAGNKAAQGRDRHDQGRGAEHGLPRHRLGDPGRTAAAGMSQDFPLAYFYTVARTLRFADGPDEVHRNASPRSSSVGTRPERADRPRACRVRVQWSLFSMRGGVSGVAPQVLGCWLLGEPCDVASDTRCAAAAAARPKARAP